MKDKKKKETILEKSKRLRAGKKKKESVFFKFTGFPKNREDEVDIDEDYIRIED